MRFAIAAATLACVAAATAQPATDWDAVRYKYWPAADRPAWAQLEAQLNEIPDPGVLADVHEQLAAEPHPTGSLGDAKVVDKIAELMESYALEVERQPLWVYISRPVDAALEIIEPEHISLPLKESPVPGDDGAARDDVSIGWNAYSASGDVFGEVVYANYGRTEDFDKIDELGVSVTGKIVICRYGQIHRGLKAQLAEQRGAIGLILFTDPADDGWGKGRPYPEGGYANETSIQRGSIKNLPYPGDPLTPKREATQDAQRDDEFEVGLPAIPVQPIGWGAARQILERMKGDPAPSGWAGGLPFVYCVEGGPSLKVRLMVEQAREIVKTWNVIGTLKGTSATEVEIFVGAHHDAWTFGAADPLAGTICMLEAARSLSELAAAGHPPYRTIKFCAWAAEEHGLIGSTEYVEARAHFMGMRGGAYINLDAAALGPDFSAMSSPGLRTLIAEVSRDVPQAGDPTISVYDAWLERGEDPNVPGEPKFGDVGGGSDHVAFWGRSGVSSCGLGAGGAKGTAYHTAYDTINWYRQVVGSDYESALMVTRMTNLITARLAYAPVIPLDPRRVLIESRAIVADLSREGLENGLFSTPNGLFDAGQAIAPELARLAGGASYGIDGATRAYDYIMQRVGDGQVSPDFIDKLTQSFMAAERVWVYDRGIPDRTWYANLYSLPDEEKGYGASLYPWLRTAIRRADLNMFIDGEIKYLASIVQAAQTVERAEMALKTDPASYPQPESPESDEDTGG